MKEKIVLVSGCYDLLHGGHIAFFKTAAAYGKLYVAIGQDKNILNLKGKAPYFSEKERLYIVASIKYVHEAFISSGSGMLDFEPDMRRINPDIFIVNEDGHTPAKKTLCDQLGVEYIVLKRIPEEGLPARSSSSSKREMRFPYRICIAGGWVDQPWVSEIHPGSVVVAQIWPTVEFNDRSGMATSSRKVAIELWNGKIPEGDQVRNARLLFGAENPPGSQYISGSQDHLGLLLPGVNRLYYEGKFWPSKIESNTDLGTCEWLSSVLHLIPLEPRPEGYDPLKERNLDISYVRDLGMSGDECWQSILHKDIKGLGRAMTKSFLTWKKMMPITVPDSVLQDIKTKYLDKYAGAITSGSGGGYVLVASETEIKGSISIKVKI
ncbi:MAG TPA: adenylyltransferase/cytidyltransferase family protein [Bacteroidales bacterium]|nr:adenylyltransferase/cytidyltransferase family protein [Bacteroidales bacterium]